MASIGEGAARGLESGFRMGQTFLDRRDQEEQRRQQQQRQADMDAERRADREFDRQRLTTQDARLARQDARLEARQVAADERQQNLDAEQALGAEFAELQGEGRALLEQFGDFSKVPKDIGDSYAMRVKDTRGRLNAQRAKRYAPIVEAQRRQAGELWSRIQAGQIPLDQVPDDQLVTSLTALTRRDIADLLPSQGGGPSPVQQAGLDFMAAAETGNDEMMLNAANVLFKPELQIGVGGPGRDGSEILSKRIVQLIPHPNDPQQFTPLLEVKVRREDGKVGTYRAPVTVNRSADPDDDIRTITLKDGLERVGQLTTLAEALNQRGIIERLQAGQQTAGDGPKSFLEAYYATGGTKPAAKKVDIGHFEDFGGYKVHYLPDGRQVRINKTATPSAAAATETSSRERQIERALKAGDITPEEAKKARRDLAMGGGKAGGGAPTEDERKSAGYASRMEASLELLDRISAEGANGDPSLYSAALGMLPEGVANPLRPEARGRVEDAQIDALDAALTLATGAAYTREQLRGLARSYFPVYGDGPKQIAEKRERLENIIDTARIRAGRAEGDIEAAREKRAARRPAGGANPGQPAAAPPAGGMQPGVDLGASRVPARPRPAQQPQPGEIREGAIAVNPATGQKIQLRGGQWQPL